MGNLAVDRSGAGQVSEPVKVQYDTCQGKEREVYDASLAPIAPGSRKKLPKR
jgi:hypothetical protein